MKPEKLTSLVFFMKFCFYVGATIWAIIFSSVDKHFNTESEKLYLV
jgi:hypothetical protein